MNSRPSELSGAAVRLPETITSIASASIFSGEHTLALHSEKATVHELSSLVEDEAGALSRFLDIVLKNAVRQKAPVSLH